MCDLIERSRRSVLSIGLSTALASLLVLPGCMDAVRTRSDIALDDASGAAPAAALAAPAAPAQATGAPAGGEADKLPLVPRKIVYNANVSLVVENLSNVENEVNRLVRDAGGYISESDIAS